ncbi:MAG: RNA polymerase sigma factor [Rickettsiales bacterium]|nr:RNA polymerase sigma factor [Rickettsiales bacterium]
MKDKNDDTLVDLALNGNTHAFETLIRRYYDMIYAISYKWMGNREEAEDNAQEVLLKITRKLDRFDKRATFKSWVYRITINNAKDMLRSRNKHQKDELFEDQAVSEQANGEHELIAKQLMQEIHKLPEKLRDALLLVCGEGMSHRDAAEILDCGEATVSWRIHKARKRLKQNLSQLEDV